MIGLPHGSPRPPASESRIERDLQRGRSAAARVRAGGGSALAAAFAHIETTFSPAVHHSMAKDRVAALIRAGAAHPETWTRYRGLADRYPFVSLEGAIALVERMRCAELEARAASCRNWGLCGRPRLALMILDELRLMLRLFRRHAAAQFPAVVAMIRSPDATASPAEAAE